MLEGRAKTLLAIVLLAGIALAIYVPHMGNSYVQWDRVAYKKVLYTTDYYRTVLDLIADFKGRIVSGYYAPLSSISLMVDKFLLGSSQPEAWFTLTINLILHCLNGALVLFLLRVLGVGEWTSRLAALIFLIHPIQVASVLWFAQRKGLLAGAFYLASCLTYFRYRETFVPTRYWLCLVFFVAGLLSKPTVVTLPLVFLVTELLFREGEPPGQVKEPVAGEAREERTELSSHPGLRKRITGELTRPGLVRIAPFLVISALFVIVTLTTEKPGEAYLPLVERPFVAATALWFYIGKILFPVNLAPIYPLWDVDVSNPAWWVPLISVTAALILLLRYRATIGKHLLWGLGCFLAPLLPVVGLFKFSYLGLSYVADHFLYLSMVGASCCLAVLIGRFLTDPRGAVKYGTTAVAVGYLAFLAVQTSRQATVWENSVVLWTHNLKYNPESWRAHNLLGHALLEDGKADQAVRSFQKALKLRRDRADLHEARAAALGKAGAASRAERHGHWAHTLRKGLASSHYNLGNALFRANRVPESMEEFQEALRKKPDFDKALTNLAVACIASGNVSDAVTYLDRAVSMNPDNVEAHRNLAIVHLEAGKFQIAVRHFEEVAKRRPDSGKALVDLGMAYLRWGKTSRAKTHFEKAAKMRPNDADAHHGLGLALQEEGRTAEANEHLTKARRLRLEPSPLGRK